MKQFEETNWRHNALYQEIFAAIEKHMTTMPYDEILAVIGQVAGGFSIFIPEDVEALKTNIAENFDLGRKANILKLDKLARTG